MFRSRDLTQRSLPKPEITTCSYCLGDGRRNSSSSLPEGEHDDRKLQRRSDGTQVNREESCVKLKFWSLQVQCVKPWEGHVHSTNPHLPCLSPSSNYLKTPFLIVGFIRVLGPYFLKLQATPLWPFFFLFNSSLYLNCALTFKSLYIFPKKNERFLFPPFQTLLFNYSHN